MIQIALPSLRWFAPLTRRRREGSRPTRMPIFLSFWSTDKLHVWTASTNGLVYNTRQARSFPDASKTRILAQRETLGSMGRRLLLNVYWNRKRESSRRTDRGYADESHQRDAAEEGKRFAYL